MNPKVSILVPVYGVEKFIKRCAVSLFEQTYDNIEYIFVDDCGKDNSIGLLHEVIEGYPQRRDNVRIIRHEKNRGLAAARNTAVAAATGEFVMHVDSDDWVDNTIVEKCVKRIVEDSADIVVTDSVSVFPRYTVNERWKEPKNGKDMAILQISGQYKWSVWAMMFKRNLYIDNCIEVKEGCNMGEDYQTAPRLSYFCDKVAFVHENLYFHDRCNENSYCNTFNESHYKQREMGVSVLFNFFKDKEPEYLYMVEKSQLFHYIESIKEISKDGGHQEIYEICKREIKQLLPRYVKTLSLYEKIIVLLIDNRIALSTLCRVMSKLKVKYLELRSLIIDKNKIKK